MKKLTIEQIDNELRKLMLEQPTFTYNDDGTGGCFYHKGPLNDPDRCDGCIFGQAFQRLGFSKETLISDLSNEYILGIKADWLPDKKPDYWAEIQQKQDEGIEWGELMEYLPEP